MFEILVIRLKGHKSWELVDTKLTQRIGARSMQVWYAARGYEAQLHTVVPND